LRGIVKIRREQAPMREAESPPWWTLLTTAIREQAPVGTGFLRDPVPKRLSNNFTIFRPNRSPMVQGADWIKHKVCGAIDPRLRYRAEERLQNSFAIFRRNRSLSMFFK